MANRTCTEDGCDSPVVGRGRCEKHWRAWRADLKERGLPLPPRPPKPRTAPKPCSIDDCGGTAVKRGWCATHYSRWRRTGDPGADIPVAGFLPGLPSRSARPADGRCSVETCDKPAGGRGWCNGHYERWRLTGDVRADVPLKVLSAPRPADATCAIEDCGRSLKKGARGWCAVHYTRWRVYGDPLGGRWYIDDDRERLEAGIDRSGGPDACHPWTGGQHAAGYGWMRWDGGPRMTHVIAWELENGPKPAGTDLDHECHNQAIRDGLCAPGKCAHRLCCNLAHIVLRTKSEHMSGTPGRSMRRRVSKKLTVEQIRELHALLKDASGNKQIGEIATRYGISLTHAYRFKRGTVWKDLLDAA